MESLQPAQPVLSYAREEAVGSAILWHDDGTGGQVFIVPPPPLARLIVLPAIGMFIITPIAVIGLLAAFFTVMAEFEPGTFFGGSVLAFLFGAIWILAIKRLAHVARHGRKPFVLRISPEGFGAMSPYRNENTPLDARPVVNVNWECLPGEFPVRIVLLRILFIENEHEPLAFSYTPSDDRALFHIPWPNREPLRPWEDRLFEALVNRSKATPVTSPSQSA